MVQLPEINDLSSHACRRMSSLILETSTLPTWGNARDMIQLSKKMIQVAFLSDSKQADDESIRISAEDAIRCVENMWQDQQGRSAANPRRQVEAHERHPIATRMAQKVAEAEKALARDIAAGDHAAAPFDKRDPGVSDSEWNHLEACKRAERDRERKEQEAAEELKKEIEKQTEIARREKALAEELGRAAAKDEAERQ
ncbi:hypothetical protein H2248_010591 [Termitomyces sp. 'cryptogamus']|nr:hypothetical protein H2248_010591 [Termitomyces sp. 'cryptogamus']